MSPLRFTITEDDAVRSQRLHLSQYLWLFFGTVLVIALVASLPVLPRIGDWPIRSILFEVATTIGSAAAMAVVLLVILRQVFFPLVARKHFREQAGFEGDMQFTWTETEFSYVSGQSQTVLPFTRLHSYRMSDDLVLLYLSSVLYLIVPVRAFDGTQQKAEFIGQLAQAGLRQR